MEEYDVSGVPFNNIDKLLWQTDFNGDEVGYDDVLIVGYYTYGEVNIFIDVYNGRVLEVWFDDQDN